jgi:hypothetical protein
VIGRSACIFYGRTGAAYNWPPASIFYGKTGPDRWTNERVLFKKEQRLKPLLPLVFCFALGYQTEHWVCCGRGEGEKATRAIKWRAEKEEKLVRFFSSLELLRKGEKRDSKEGFESLEALPLLWLGGVFVPFRTFFLFLFFVVLGPVSQNSVEMVWRIMSQWWWHWSCVVMCTS